MTQQPSVRSTPYEARRAVNRKCLALLAGASLASVTGLAVAGPEGGEIVSGAGTISQIDPATTLISQDTARIGIDWESFNVGESERVVFDQPSASAAALNRIFDQNPSQILGALDANGHVYLVNPNGLVFGQNAQINVGALIASSLDISLDDFNNGNYVFERSPGGGGLVVNRGVIHAADGGSVSLLGAAVANEGLIIARLGQVNLGAGESAALDFSGDGLLYFEIDDALLANAAGTEAAVSNTGTIAAEGGSVVLSGRAAQDVFANLVNNEGILRATRIEDTGGTIRLVGDGGSVVSSGVIDATGQGGAGGTVQILGDRVGLFGDAVVDVSGATDGGVAQIGGGFRGRDPDIDNADRTYVSPGSRISADAGAAGDGGQVVVWADEVTRFYGEVSARGGAESGDGGLVEVSGKKDLVFRGDVDTRAPNGATGTLLLDPDDLTISNAMSGAGADDGEIGGADGTLAFGDAGAAATISAGALEALASSTDISLQANNSITVEDLTVAGKGGVDNELTLLTDGSVEFLTGAGGFTMNDTGDTINVTGTGTLTIDTIGASSGGTGDGDIVTGDIQTTGGSVTLNGVNVTAGDVSTVGGADAAGGAVSLTATAAGTLTTGALTTTGGAATATGQAAGGVTLAGGDIDVGAITATGSAAGGAGNDDGGAGGTVAITAQGDLTLGGSLDTSGGTETGTGTAGTDGDVTLLAGQAGAGSTSTVAGAITAGTVTLTGGAGADQFDLNADVAGDVDGAPGNDTFNITANQSGGVDGGADDDTVNLADGITVGGTLTGGAGGTDSDVLAADDAVNAFVIDAVDGGNLNGQAFSEFENLTGGSLGDTFTFTALLTGTASGGGDDDTFELNDGGGAATIDGGAESTADTVTFAGSTGPVTVAVDAFTSIESIVGSPDANDVLQGTTGNDTFQLTGGNSGTETASGTDYSEFENLDGLAGSDTFAISAGGSVAGTIDGGGGSDTVQGTSGDDTFQTSGADQGSVAGSDYVSVENLAGLGGDDTFNLDHDVTGGVDGGDDDDTVNLADGITVGGTLTGGSGGTDSDTLAADDAVNAFVIDSGDGGNLNGQAFSEFENLTGGSLGDTFTFTAALTGTASGGDDDDTFELDDGGSAGMIDGGSGAETVGDNVTYAGRTSGVTVAADVFTEIESLIGSGFDDTLQGTGGVDAFAITGADTGTVGGAGGVVFSDFEILEGLAGNDTFALNADFGGALTLSGGGDDDLFTVSVAQTGAVDLVGGAGGDTFTLDAENGGLVQGEDGDDTFHINSDATADGVDIEGGNDNDTFNINVSLTPSAQVLGQAGSDAFFIDAAASGGDLDGGADSDSVTIVNGAAALNISVANGGTANGNTVAGTESWNGSPGDDDIVVNAAADTGVDALGGDDMIHVTAVGFDVAIDGNLGNDTIVDETNTARTFDVTGTDDGNITNGVGFQIDFTDVENLTAGTADDSFTFSGGALSGTAAGNAGTDTLVGDGAGRTFDITGANDGAVVGLTQFTGMENLTGGGGVDTFNIVGGSLGGTLNGGGGSDILVADNAINTFNITGANSGDTNAVTSFVSIENLTGNAQVDTFNFDGALDGTASGGGDDDMFAINDGGSVGGVDGGAGSDTVSYAGTTTAVTVSTGTFTAVETLVGSSDNGDTLQGSAGAETFQTNGVDSGTVAGIAYSSFENLAGLAGDDIFNLDHDVTGGVDAGADSDTVNLASGVTVGGSLTGGTTGTNMDTLVAGDAVNAFVIDSGDGGSLNGQAFSSFENLTGGSLADAFTFTAALTGTASGGDGDDTFALDDGGSAATIDGGAETVADTVTYAGRSAGVTVAADTFTGIEALVGSGFGDALQGTPGDDIFTTAGADAGSVGTIAYSSFESLDGLGGADTFNLNDDVSGGVAGGAGGDTFNVNAAVTSAVLGGAGDDAFNIDAGVAGSTNLDGEAGMNTVTVVNGSGVLNVTSLDAGTINGNTVANMQTWRGSATAADTFNLGAALTNGAFGQGGNDQFNITATGISVTVSGGAGSDTVAALPAQATTFNITGADAGDFANGAGTVTFTATENLTGSSAADTFDVAGGSLSGLADGGAGSDTLQADDVANVFTTTGANAGTVTGTGAVGAFANVENLSGGSAVDTFNLGHGISGSVLGNGGNDIFTVNAAQTGNLAGGAGNDTFTVNANVATAIAGQDGNDIFNVNAAIGGSVDGAAGTDTLSFAGNGTARNVGLTGVGVNGFAGTETGITGGFTGIDVLVGSSASDALSGIAAMAATWAISGNAGNTYTVGATALTFSSFESLIGSAAVDTFNLLGTGGTPYAGNLSLNGGGGADSANVTGDFAATGNVSLVGIESVRMNNDTLSLAADGLSIDGASSGVGTADVNLTANINSLSITNSDGGVYVTDQTPGLDVVVIDIASGDVSVILDALGAGDLNLGLVNTGGGADLLLPPTDGGKVRLEVANGSIVNGNGADVNLRGGDDATLIALGQIGSSGSVITIVIPESRTINLIRGTSGPAFINNVSQATEVLQNITFVQDLTENLLGLAGSISAATSLQDFDEVDWRALDPTVTSFDVSDEGVLLPEDQREELASEDRQPDRLILIRTNAGWKLVAAFDNELISAVR